MFTTAAGWSWADHHLDGNPICSKNLTTRAAVVAGQAVVASLLYGATRRHESATRVVTTVLVTGWAAAFAAHIAISAKTRSAMPGLGTSLVPGIPGAVLVLRHIWRRDTEL